MTYDYDRRNVNAATKFKIEGVEFVRTDTYKVYVDAGKEGKLRVVIYPGDKMSVLSDGPVQWLEHDLSGDQRKKLLKAVKDFKARESR